MSSWAMTIDKQGNRFVARVIRADHTFKIGKGAQAFSPLTGIAPPQLRA